MENNQATKWILAADQINAGSRIQERGGTPALNKFLDGRAAIGWWNTLVPSNGEGRPCKPAHPGASPVLLLVARPVSHRLPRLGCPAPLRCSNDGRTEQCGGWSDAFLCSKTKPCSVLAGFSAAAFAQLGWFHSAITVTSGQDDAL